MTRDQIYNKMADWTVANMKGISINRDQVFAAINSTQNTFNYETRASWKFGCSWNVAGTPVKISFFF